MFDLTGKVALVTGAGQGVGAGIARGLAGRRAGRRQRRGDERAQADGDEIDGEGGGGGRGLRRDRLRGGRRAAVEGLGRSTSSSTTPERRRRGMRPTVPRPDPAGWEGPIQVNLYGVLNCCRAVINPMCDRGWGRIITISSGAGTVGLRIGVSPYAAGKGGGLSLHAPPRGGDGAVRGHRQHAGARADGRAGRAQRDHRGAGPQIPVGRLGTADDIGAACVYLASPEASWMTGQTIQINGGAVTT